MKNIILLTHGDFSKGIAQSCRFILGEVQNMTALSITLNETVDEVKAMVEEARAAFGNGAPTILLTDIPGGSTTQVGIRVMAEHQDVYLVTGLNLGLLVSLILLELSDNHENNLAAIRHIVAEARNTITLVNDMEAGAGLTEDGEL